MPGLRELNREVSKEEGASGIHEARGESGQSGCPGQIAFAEFLSLAYFVLRSRSFYRCARSAVSAFRTSQTSGMEGTRKGGSEERGSRARRRIAVRVR